MGTGAGIGIDIVECENVPTPIDLKDELEKPHLIKRFAIGQNTQIIQDENNAIYLVGLKLHYLPKKMSFDPEILDVNNVRLLACGKKHYVIVNNDNNLLVWGSIFKEKSEIHTEGFSFHNGDELFDGGKVTDLQVKYGIFGALV